MASHFHRHLLALAIMGFCGLTQAAPRVFTLAEVQKPGHPVVTSEEHMNRVLADSSKEALKLDIRHSGELGTDVMPRLIKGELDMARVGMNSLNKYAPTAILMGMPYLFRSSEHMWSALDGEFGQQLVAEAEKVGVIILCYYESGSRNFYSVKKPLTSRQDFQGLRVRVPPKSPIYDDLVINLGATPVTVAYNQILDGFKDGSIDAAENNLPSYVSSGHHKVARYLSMDEHLMVPEILLMSKTVWDKLSPQEQTWLREAAQNSSDFMRQLWEKERAEALVEAKKAGVIIIEKNKLAYTGFETAAMKLYSKYVTDLQSMQTALKVMRSK